jgi:hypothetical protein
MSFQKLRKAHRESSRIFHEKITPKLPKEIQQELANCQTFSYRWEGKPVKIILSVNGKEFDITEWYEPIETIFDVYGKV